MKHTPVRIWCAPEGEYGQGFDAVHLRTWSERQEYRDGFETQYVRADISDEVLEALQGLIAAYSEPDQQLCCDGRDCGCMGSTIRQLAEHYARAAVAKATGQ